MTNNNQCRGWSDLPKIAWVTGAGKGIGRALALRLARDGWTVHASARTADDLEELAKEASSLRGDIISQPLDITDAGACAETVKNIADMGALGLVVLNAGNHIPTPRQRFSVGRCEYVD